MVTGTTFSHRYCTQLGISPDEVFEQLLEFKFDVVRLCCYWDEIQPQKDMFDFSVIQKYLAQCEKHNLNVILTVGMKAPRWPEFYIPKWLDRNDENFDHYLFEYLKKTVTELKSYSCIKYWQIENEPLDPSGPHNITIPTTLLNKEINLVKEIDPDRKILLTVWGNHLIKRNCIPQLHPQADIVGLDLYYKVPTVKILHKTFYTGPNDSTEQINDHLTCTTKPIWITELQAEPWEKGVIIPKMKNPQSINATILETNFRKAVDLKPQGILFWGFEYWVWRKVSLYDDSLFLLARSLI